MPSSNTPAKVSDTNGSEGRGGDASDAKSAKEQQWVEEEGQRSIGQQHLQARRRDPTLILAIIQRNTSVPTIYDSQKPVTAILVDEEDIPAGEIFEAQAVGFFEQKWKLMVIVVVVVAGALLALGLTIGRKQPSPITPSPTSSPTLKPTFDQRPTLELIQERGFVKCGWNDRFVPLRYRVCELVASVLFGDPSKMKHVPVTKDDRFFLLEEREADLLVDSVSYSIQREVKEPLTKGSYIFSKIYFYVRAIYMGNQTYVECAESKQRYGHCSEMRICAAYPSSHYDFLRRQFPSDYIVPVLNPQGKAIPILDYHVNGTCNTVFDNEIVFLEYSSEYDVFNLRRNVFFGTETEGIDPQGIVTRSDDREFTDVMSWVVNAAIYGEEQNISNNPSFCKPYGSPPTASYGID